MPNQHSLQINTFNNSHEIITKTTSQKLTHKQSREKNEPKKPNNLGEIHKYGL
jgi:hypothetical protein